MSGRFALAALRSEERRKATCEERRVLAERRAWRERLENVEIAERLAELRAAKREDDARAKAWCARHGVVWAWGEAAVEVTPDELRWGLAVYGVGSEAGHAGAGAGAGRTEDVRARGTSARGTCARGTCAHGVCGTETPAPSLPSSPPSRG